MRTPALRITLLACLATALVAPASAAADPVRDCSTNGTLTRHYSAGELGAALRSMPADVKEYTDCYDQIRRAQLAAAGGAAHRRKTSPSGSGGDGSSGGGGGGTGGSGGSSGSAAAKGSGRSGTHAATASGAAANGAKPVKVGARDITPGTSGLSSGGADVPTPLVVVLALLGAGGLAFAATRIRSRVGDRRGT